MARTWALAFSKTRESGAWEHSLLVADGPKKRGLLSACGGNRDDIGSGVSTDDNLSLQICDEPRPGAVFFLRRGAILRSLRGDQYHRSSVVLRFKDADDYPFFGRNLGKFHHRAVVHLCHEPVTASSAAMRSLMSSCGRGKVAFPFAAAATTACPSATSALSSTTCVVGTQTLAAWEVASCARTAGGSPVTGRRKIPVVV